jgi:ATP phosphoribosyltransferase regulatory subunit
MGVRADMTQQVARIATTRLTRAPRPLRLAYSGQVLRVRGSQLRPEREFLQAGAELIGAAEPTADAETICLAAAALQAVGVRDVSVDINLPTLVPSLCDALGLEPAVAQRLRAALDRKDIAEVEAVGGPASVLFAALLNASGPAIEAMAALDALDLLPVAIVERNRLGAVIELVTQAMPDVMLTVDPVEHRGFEYHTGLSFTLFARGVRGEIGSGGRYRAGAANEPATGFTLFLDSVLRAVDAPDAPGRVFLPFGTSPEDAAALRHSGRIAVAGLAPVADTEREARRLGCTEMLVDGRVVVLESDEGLDEK